MYDFLAGKGGKTLFEVLACLAALGACAASCKLLPIVFPDKTEAFGDLLTLALVSLLMVCIGWLIVKFFPSVSVRFHPISVPLKPIVAVGMIIALAWVIYETAAPRWESLYYPMLVADGSIFFIVAFIAIACGAAVATVYAIRRLLLKRLAPDDGAL